MMKYYLCVVIGIGTDEDAYRPKIAEYECNWAGVYETPDQNNVIVAVNASMEVFEQINSDAEILYLGEDVEVMTSEEFQRICPNGMVMVYG